MLERSDLSDYIHEVIEFNHPENLKLLIAIISTISQIALTWKKMGKGVVSKGRS
jgi:hypothetical protein